MRKIWRFGLGSYALMVLAAGIWPVSAQNTARPHVVMLSDIHLDPFHDPAKFVALTRAPAEAWRAILNAPDTASRAADYAALQATCKAKGEDTSAALFANSLRAEHERVARPLFVTVSGDLMAHQFDCRYSTLAAQNGITVTAATYSAFAAKTVAFVALQLRQTFAGVPVYLALGNNDSGCRDYREDADSAFLKNYARAAASDAGTDKAARSPIAQDAAEFGDSSIRLPMPHARLLVLQDIFESAKYTDCGDSAASAGDAVQAAAERQQAWLHAQLVAARARHERLWVMAHIPPGIDAYSTLKSGNGGCTSERAPTAFLSSEAFATNLAQFADVIQLVLLGHTHMDEMRAYTSLPGAPAGIVPGKLVASISPVDGNTPSFTVGDVDPARATLMDYAVYRANDIAGASAWTEAYRYSTIYGEPDLSGASLGALTQSFLADKTSSDAKTQAYERFYFVGEAIAGVPAAAKAAALRFVWPAYACSITQATTAGFHACVCAAEKSDAPTREGNR